LHPLGSNKGKIKNFEIGKLKFFKYIYYYKHLPNTRETTMNTTKTRVDRYCGGAIEAVCIYSEVKKQIVFIDARVEDYQSLAAGVVAGTEVVIIDPAKKWN